MVAAIIDLNSIALYKYYVYQPSSMNLSQRLASLQNQINQVKSQFVAPPLTWIVKYYVEKNGQKYYYYRLMEASEKKSRKGDMRGKVKLYLGTKRNPKYLRYKKAVERRRHLKELERRYKRLLALYEKSLMVSEVSNSYLKDDVEAVEPTRELAKTAPSEIIAKEEMVKWMKAIERSQQQIQLALTRLTKAIAQIIGNDCKWQSE